MKLSEAILLGSTVLTPQAGGQHFSETRAGCALGMAAVAKGCTFRTATRAFPEEDRRTLGTEGVWGDWVLNKVARPCACWRFWIPREMRIKDIIAHLFDYHVMAKKNWTLDQLAAWVQTVEPTEARDRGIPSELIAEFWRLQAAHQHEAVDESQQERDDPDDWQKRVSAFTARHHSARSRVSPGR